jgi:membrane-bound metal-dependent hydrolase YbcI (DUF457 family)
VPQVGLHAGAGLLGSQAVIAGLAAPAPLKRAMIFGFMLGNLLPDFDLVASVMMWLHDQTLALSLHRGFTHSLFFCLLAASGFSAGAVIVGDREPRYFGFGVSLGVLTHLFADMLLWFSPVDVLWPLGFFGIPSEINLWEGWTTPPLLERLLTAAEFGAFALYYRWLWHLSVRYGTNPDLRPQLVRLESTCLVLWVAYSALAFDLNPSLFEGLIFVPIGVLFMPFCLYVTVRMRATIEAMATPALSAARARYSR